MRYDLIDAENAPRPHPKMNQRGALMEAIVSELTTGEAARIQLEGPETVRGTKASLSRAAKRLGRSIVTWDAEGRVYAELDEKPTGRQRRTRRAPAS